MQTLNTKTSWGWPSRAIHWITAGILLWTMGLGVYMTNFVQDPLQQFALTQTHKSWGFLVFALAVMRVVWLAIARRRPALPEHCKPYERAGAHISHTVLYISIFLLPLSGWVMSAASPLQDLLNIENMVFTWFAMPDPWVPGVASIEKTASAIHYYAGIVLGLTLLAHVGAALKHHLIDKDTVLTRMTWGR